MSMTYGFISVEYVLTKGIADHLVFLFIEMH